MIILILLLLLVHFLLPLKNIWKIKNNKVLTYICIIISTDLFTVIMLKNILEVGSVINNLHISYYIIVYTIICSILSLLINNKKDIEKILKKVDQISEKKWLIITFLILLVFMMSLSYKMLYEPYIMVEDGKIFLNQQLKYGILSIFKNYGGYCILTSRLSAFIAAHVGSVFNSFVVTINTLKWITIIIEVLIFNYINTKDFDFLIKKRTTKLLLSLFTILLFDNFQFCLYNTTSIHWVCGYLCFLSGLKLINNELPSKYIIPVIAVAILSSSSSLILGFAMLYFILRRVDFKNLINGTLNNFTKSELIRFFVLGLSLLGQVIYILIIGKTGAMAENVSIFSAIYKSIICFLQVPILLSGTYIALKFTNIYVSSIFGIIIYLFIYLLCKRKTTIKYFGYYIVCGLFLYFMILFKNNNSNYYLMLFNEKYWYYNVLPALALFTVVFINLTRIKYDIKKSKIIIMPLIALLCFSLYQHIYIYNFEFAQSFKSIDECVDFSSNDYLKVKVFPGGKWYVNVPIDYNCYK